jgi:hypothetical protein
MRLHLVMLAWMVWISPQNLVELALMVLDLHLWESVQENFLGMPGSSDSICSVCDLTIGPASTDLKHLSPVCGFVS